MLTADAQYAANLATLGEQEALAPLLAQMAQMPLTNMQLMPGPTGHLTGIAWDVPSQQWVPLCHPVDPMGVAEQALNQPANDSGQTIWNKETTVFTMIGVGLGYEVVAFAKRLLPYQRLVVWDPEGTFFKAMLHAQDIREVFTGKRVEINVGSDILSKIEPWYLSLEVHEKLHMAFPVSLTYTSLYRKTDYDAVMARVMEMLRYHMVGLATWRQFGACIGDNDLENMPEYYQNPGLAHMKDLWKGKPAVCVAAGPSLQRNLRYLLPAEVRSKLALITVGTTYGLLQGMGLQPDIATTIDFQRLNWTDQFEHLPLDPDCTLVYLHSTYPQTVRRWPGPTFVAKNSSDTMTWIAQFDEEDKGSAGQVQTVAHLNLLVALALGANPIILLGQDLSMPAAEHHAAGARAQDTSPAEVAPEAFIDVTDMHGQPVKTRHSFQSMLLVFERIIAEHPETTFLNCSEQGLHIKGAQHMPLTHALALLGFLHGAPQCAQPVQYSAPVQVASSAAVRPLFQGESVASLAAAAVSPLRLALKATYEAYVPKVKPIFQENFTKIVEDVETIGTWAHETQQRWQALEARLLTAAERQMAQSSDVLSDVDTLETLRQEEYQAILASEKVLHERPHACGMYVIRRFDFIELKGEIPPDMALLAEPWQRARYDAHRLVRAAAMFAEELPTLRRLLRIVGKRLQPGMTFAQRMVRQQYRRAHELFPREDGSRDALIHLLCHTQQYEAALTLMRLWRTSGTQEARLRQRLTAYHADVRRALPAYFTEQPAAPVAYEGKKWDIDAVSIVPLITLNGAAMVGSFAPDIALGSAINGIPLNGHTPAPVVQDEAGYLMHDNEEERYAPSIL